MFEAVHLPRLASSLSRPFWPPNCAIVVGQLALDPLLLQQPGHHARLACIDRDCIDTLSLPLTESRWAGLCRGREEGIQLWVAQIQCRRQQLGAAELSQKSTPYRGSVTGVPMSSCAVVAHLNSPLRLLVARRYSPDSRATERPFISKVRVHGMMSPEFHQSAPSPLLRSSLYYSRIPLVQEHPMRAFVPGTKLTTARARLFWLCRTMATSSMLLRSICLALLALVLFPEEAHAQVRAQHCCKLRQDAALLQQPSQLAKLSPLQRAFVLSSAMHRRDSCFRALREPWAARDLRPAHPNRPHRLLPLGPHPPLHHLQGPHQTHQTQDHLGLHQIHPALLLHLHHLRRLRLASQTHRDPSPALWTAR